MNTTKWYKNPEMIVAFSALVIGIVTAFTSIYSAYVDRQYARAAVWPRLEIFRSYTEDTFSYGVNNSGTGPALIKYAKVRDGDRYIKSWSDVEAFREFTQSHIGLRTLSPQSNITPLIYKGENAMEFNKADANIKLELCYCSIYDECWLIDKTNQPKEVDACIADAKDLFLQ